MAEPFIGEIRLFPFNFAPRGWAQCNGQILSVQQNQALYALIGAKFGGNGTTTFALPNLQSRAAVNVSPAIAFAQVAGEESHTLTVSEIPQHTHELSGSSDGANVKIATGNVSATTAAAQPIYADEGSQTMGSSALGTSGSSAPHSNMQPYTVLNFCIATQGIWPPRN